MKFFIRLIPWLVFGVILGAVIGYTYFPIGVASFGLPFSDQAAMVYVSNRAIGTWGLIGVFTAFSLAYGFVAELIINKGIK